MKFEINQAVKLIGSPEAGTIIGRAEFDHSENQYIVRYQDGTACLVERWWGESALEAP